MPYRRKSGQQRRKLAKVGSDRVHNRFELPADQQRIVQTMMRQKSRRCIETGEADELDHPGYRQYYPAMTECFTRRTIACYCAGSRRSNSRNELEFCLCEEDFYGCVTTFEGGDWRRFSPSKILKSCSKWSFSNGIAIFDFGIGD